jgi:hypothetical protein
VETNEVSLHLLKVFMFIRDAKGWVTNQEIAKGAGVNYRTVAWHTKSLVSLGILDHAEVFPGHRFKLSNKSDMRNKAYTLRIQQAMNVFGLQ